MNIAKQRVKVWNPHKEEYMWTSLREYIEGVGLTNLRPCQIYPGMTETRSLYARGVIDCDPGGSEYHGGNEHFKRGGVARTEQEILCSRWKKGRCAYIYNTRTDGIYLMIPKPLKVFVEVKVML